MSVFGFKEGSTNSRIQIWKNSLGLIYKKPITGYGFGEFEKEYNMYAAQKLSPVNDHVITAYNDIIELGVEGGLIAIILWLAF